MNSDWLVVVVVVGLRLVIPLFTFRYPLPAILAALVIDAADQTLFQQLTEIDLAGYQGYDKALDIYYLTIAYLSVLRNWSHPTAIALAIGLWYYRLVGVGMFEVFEWRPLLIIFPNTFEYFFIFMELVRLKWSTARLTARTVVLAAAAIWVFIKLPQEWWIHIAQLDFTDFMKEDVFGVEATESWGAAFANRPLVSVLIVGLVLAVTVAGVVVWRRLPPGDHRFTFDADRVPSWSQAVAVEGSSWTYGLFEKVALIALVSIVFVNGLAQSSPSVVDIVVAVGLLVVGNAAVTQWLLRFERAWSSTYRAFFATLVVNSGLWVFFSWLLPSDDRSTTNGSVAFNLLLLSLLVTLFDRYRPMRRPFALELDSTYQEQLTPASG